MTITAYICLYRYKYMYLPVPVYYNLPIHTHTHFYKNTVLIASFLASTPPVFIVYCTNSKATLSQICSGILLEDNTACTYMSPGVYEWENHS